MRPPLMFASDNDGHALVIRSEIEPLYYRQALLNRPLLQDIQGLWVQTPLRRIARDRGEGYGGVYSRWYYRVKALILCVLGSR